MDEFNKFSKMSIEEMAQHAALKLMEIDGQFGIGPLADESRTTIQGYLDAEITDLKEKDADNVFHLGGGKDSYWSGMAQAMIDAKEIVSALESNGCNDPCLEGVIKEDERICKQKAGDAYSYWMGMSVGFSNIGLWIRKHSTEPVMCEE